MKAKYINKYKDYFRIYLYSIFTIIFSYMNFTEEAMQHNLSDKFDNSSCLCPQIVESENKDTWEYFEDRRTDSTSSPILNKWVEKIVSSSIVENSVASSQVVKQTNLISKWALYYHLPNDKNWTLSSYKIILDNISTVEQLIAVNEGLTDNIVKHCMLFVMKVGITPMWEDKKNRNGGCFSYKVVNKSIPMVWHELMYLLCGNSLTINKKHMDFVNGITISPKRGFCIVKIWLSECSLQDPSIIVPIPLLSKMGCLFKGHTPEF